MEERVVHAKVIAGFESKDTSGYARCSEGPATTGAIKSDGGSSTYYDIAIPTSLREEMAERRNEDGLSYIKTEEIIELGLGNDFDAGNIFKCLIRMQSLKNGKGKAGNDLEYDANKVVYSAKKIAKRYSKK